jgi:hypothetical protein
MCLEYNCSSTAARLTVKPVAVNGGTTERSEGLWPIFNIVSANSRGRWNPALLIYLDLTNYRIAGEKRPCRAREAVSHSPTSARR